MSTSTCRSTEAMRFNMLFLIFFSIQGLDGSNEISGLLSNVQDIEVLTDHVINVVQAKMREQNSIRV